MARTKIRGEELKRKGYELESLPYFWKAPDAWTNMALQPPIFDTFAAC